jgi:S-DNA-T family DNA segregation ATPase FtsK/SpoIIIE
MVDSTSGDESNGPRHRGRWVALVVAGVLVAGAIVVVTGGAPETSNAAGAQAAAVVAKAGAVGARGSGSAPVTAPAGAGVDGVAPAPAATSTTSTSVAVAPITAATTATTTPKAAPTAAATTATTTPTAAPVPAVTAPAVVALPSVATLVAEVESAGVDPGPGWSWSTGDTAVECGVIAAADVSTGCTFGPAGGVRTVFSGTPTLALVAHELANAETENDAVPSLLAMVSAAEAGTSWSSIDAVATCLVEHFLGFQDAAAGSWQCPAALAATVAAGIHGTGAVAAGN